MGGPGPVPPTIEGQTYCLRWNNHKSNLVEILDALIKVESYVDCTIVVDDHVQFKAHRVVLAANSPYFQAILQDVPMDHCSIIFPGVKAFEMRALLEYMYTGEVNVTQSQIPKIMRIAEELEVKGLFDMADLKEKFNKLSEEHAERMGNPYLISSLEPPSTYSSIATSTLTSSSSSSSAAAVAAVAAAAVNSQNGNKDSSQHHSQHHHHNNSSSVISTSTNISPPIAPSSSSSPPYGYKSPFASLYRKSPGPSMPPCTTMTQNVAATTTLTSSHTQMPQSGSTDRNQWPLSPSAAAAAMLSSVYESAPDMNPLKRKKLSSLSSMLSMNRDTPILRNVLAQSNPVDSTHPMPLLLPGSAAAAAAAAAAVTAATAGKTEKSTTDKSSPHNAAMSAAAAAAAVGVGVSGTGGAGSGNTGLNNSHSFNGSDYSNEKKYHDEPHSPYTDRSFDDDAYDQKGGFSGNFGSSNSNQKPEWKRYKQYTRNDIMSAIQCVRDGMSALQASRKFGVPSRTLYDKVKKLGITTGRPMNRTMKRSPSSLDTSAAFPYAHGYGQAEPLLSSMHDQQQQRDERENKEHHHLHRAETHHLPPGISHSAATLLDHAFLQQALENRGGDMVAGREALHAMALAAAAHAAANRMSSSPGPNEGPIRSPSPNYGLKYGSISEREMMHERERERERDRDRDREHDGDRIRVRHRGRDIDDEDDQVEDLSVGRKECISPDLRKRPSSPYSPPQESIQTKNEHKSQSSALFNSSNNENGNNSVIVQPLGSSKSDAGGISDDYTDESIPLATGLKREITGDDGHTD